MWEGSSAQRKTMESLTSNGRARDVVRSRCWGVKIGEPVVDEVSVLDGGSVSIRHVSRGSLAGRAVNAGENPTNLSHEHSESNINNIISRSPSVGVSSDISSNDTQRVL